MFALIKIRAKASMVGKRDDKAVMTYKILHDLFPGSLHGKFTMRSQISVYETKNCPDDSISKHYLEFSKKFFTILQLNCGTRYLSN